ncbi:MAG: type IV pilus biogenesis/stability protein PilW [Aquabacterium sp.]|uniref:type IV pilus biogenesis/stability protein PilW n=1 Tax=Aquabacterium sp. TaxID=1872578 RepID=UPI001218037C|nr:type IV pilus biogenesis/stability protein PilW [Aquabacterium sp.]TAK93904.1 MAG: type IV pilus biogenesis/stability protein PilW [Aquabacterium sp.]
MRMLRSVVLTAGWLLACVASLGWLSGCAGGPASRMSSSGDIVTASDEGDLQKRARIRMELASTYYGQGQYNTALDELKQAVAIDPNLPDAYEMRALIYDAMGDDARAVSNYKQALSLDERNGSVLHNYGWYLCRKRQFAEADALFERASSLPQTISTSKTMLARGVCQVSAGLYPEAEKTLVHSYELDPSNPATAFNLASVLYRRGELERARFYIRRVNNVPAQVTAESLWLAIRIEHKLGNANGREEMASQLRSRFPTARETNAMELGRFDD